MFFLFFLLIFHSFSRLLYFLVTHIHEARPLVYMHFTHWSNIGVFYLIQRNVKTILIRFSMVFFYIILNFVIFFFDNFW